MKTFPQIAHELGCSRSTVERLYKSAIEKIRNNSLIMARLRIELYGNSGLFALSDNEACTHAISEAELSELYDDELYTCDTGEDLWTPEDL